MEAVQQNHSVCRGYCGVMLRSRSGGFFRRGFMLGNVEVILARPRGFCAGVERAVRTLESVASRYAGTREVYALHEIVHNLHVVNSFKKMGVKFVSALHEVPEGAVLVFSAHGVSQQVKEESRRKGLTVVDATCPLVTKVHLEIQRYDKSGYQVILVGHKGHREVEGSMGQVSNPVVLVQNVQDVQSIKIPSAAKLAYVTQTTLSMDDTAEIISALKLRFPRIVGPDLRDICYATQNRQTAVKAMSQMVDVVLAIGSKNSSNSNRLLDLAKAQNARAYLIDSYRNIDLEWLIGARRIGITAGASAPEILVQEVIDYLGLHANLKVRTMDGVSENITFKLPELD
ncbi:4-hydroxy-3-methylbut-2-enyl diphosphate reductase [Anaplasma marginale str. Dawn]|uniref:4-hydroxy-3-methylbut-2-enyl diphosphate reductase n=4 Tax=Anaplasmataceae TaxID=942 RepID=ISPH_ANAMM|nr:4-hydroxy-3-methylbut-2-enyl diphosphate reductase [Anaplasma marginale]Q5PAE7.1 RecName: Full=4-hydroxy-3-methylbut-2-enyl diphosphate reductase; Short=HMBPP reductase [Anaplasma marginale str. St. Maries]AGZ78956.1 4-hydroxy-3-methylbut-2-enyl diphosphate reductase [Anaplasma marginale str. Gypsy Plains]AAV86733.1 lytB protein [Anaplasma marginale str. St. Maries]AGZ79776.1 4-hydroxy-3-methylbut-2-enyl diphosphate reductase [Anaplasma marginale str. Dawn]AXW84163.1 4-hydroxy-3-methylbut-2